MKVLPPVGHPNGGRLGNRKERTGCLTCKKRKIKCDEYKPYCYRCTSSGRECAGYTSPFGTNRSTTSPLSEEILTTRLAVNNQEHRAFQYFANSRARTMAGPFDVELWSRLVPQLSQTIPAVRHAAMTIGALLLRIDELCLREQRPSSLALNEAYDVFAAEQYQKSIQATIHALDDKGGSPLIASTTCILYFCIEALQGDEHRALHLFDSARKAKLATTQSIPNETLLFNAESTFSRLGVQWSMFDNTAVHDVADAPVFSQPITSISQAQSELISLVTHAFDVWKVNFQEKWSDLWNASSEQVGHKLQSRQRNINDGFDDWHARFEAYKTQLNLNIELPQNSMASSTLILWHNAMSIWLAGSSARSEMIYDNFGSRFETINVEASRILNNIEQQDERVSFTFELGVIPPLYLSVLLCRQPLLRRQSLDLLRRAPAQEGLWRRAIIVRACERLIELEEGSDGFIPDVPDDLARRTVPEAMRCKTVKVELRSTSKDGTWGNHVEYYSKPYGVDGDWSIHQEFFAEL